MIREWFGFIIFGLALLAITIYMASRPEPGYCADHGLGLSFSDGRCHTFGDSKK